VAAGVVFGGIASAQAADLGGDCCADLEERIAELEATTARKGNRKVSLTISGWVSEAVFWWDDGTEQNAYVATNALEQDRFKLSGEAKIADGWSAGYTIEIGIVGAPSNKLDQDHGTNSTDANTPNPQLLGLSSRGRRTGALLFARWRRSTAAQVERYPDWAGQRLTRPKRA
jgi:hypothetical protein